MKKNFVVVLLVVFLLSMPTCEAENEPTVIPAPLIADTFGKCDAADFLRPEQGEVLFVAMTLDIVLSSPNFDTDKLMTTKSDNVYIGYSYDAPSGIFLNYYNNDNELVVMAYDSESNIIAYQFTPVELTPADVELLIAETYDEWRELDADVLEYVIEAASTLVSEIGQ